MSVGDAFDILLCLLILAVAAGALGGRDLFGAVALYVVYGLLVAIAWVRLDAIDVGLAEGAIGAGLTGVLLFRAAARLRGERPDGAASSGPESNSAGLNRAGLNRAGLNRAGLDEEPAGGLAFRPAGVALCALLALGLCWVVVMLAQPAEGGAPGLTPLVRESLPLSGAENPVTAVLLNFRAWDTLIESVVLLVALVGVWSLAPDAAWGGRPGLAQHVRPDGVLATFGRFLPPIGLVVGVYLVWVGTSAPGGAFQAGTVLAAVWLLAMMAGLRAPPAVSSRSLRWVLIAGPFVFFGVGLWGFAAGAFMALDPGQAKALILAVELALALSIAATLALLVVGPPREAA